jgi:ABC-type multidrug transport system permease subunit
MRNFATLGLAIGAPLALFSGIGVGVTLVGGPPTFLIAVLVLSVATIATSLVILSVENAKRIVESDD